ncbi:MAG: histidinol-phosphate transaminase [Bacteroidota bacterium]
MTFIQNIKSSVQALEAYSVKSKPISPDLIKLNQNENPFDLPEQMKRELVEEFLQQPWNRYPDVFPAKLIEALSQFVGIPMESIIAANGSNELMYSALMAIVSKGTKVLIPAPTFFLYEKIVRILEGELVSVPAKPDLSFDVERILATAVKERPSLIILNSPNSPTGQMLTLENIERIITGTDAMILVDEAYIEFADMPSVLPLLQRYDRLIILRTFSKAFSLAGLRIGYLLAQPAVCSELLKPKIPFTVNNLSMAAAVRVMKEKKLISERIQYIKQQKEKLFKELSITDGIKVFSSQTNFLIFQPMNNAQQLFDNLLTENVLIRDVSSYPLLENTLRVNAGTESENKLFLAAVHKYLK